MVIVMAILTFPPVVAKMWHIKKNIITSKTKIEKSRQYTWHWLAWSLPRASLSESCAGAPPSPVYMCHLDLCRSRSDATFISFFDSLFSLVVSYAAGCLLRLHFGFSCNSVCIVFGVLFQFLVKNVFLLNKLTVLCFWEHRWRKAAYK